tara:strand:- start:5498 stop:5803 length:306 start_codon:yes stop_codon:yes gene_type:complete
MSEQIQYPQMPDWRNLVSPDLLLLYIASTLGELTLDKDNHTVTMNSTYTYDVDFFDQWEALINDYRTQYLEACENNEGAANDLQLFSNFDNMISVLRQELK